MLVAMRPGRVEPEPGAQVGRLSGRVEGGQTEYVARRCLLRTLEARVRVQRREPLPEVGEIAARGGVPREVAFREDQQVRDGDLAPGFLETVDRLAPFTASTSVTTPLVAKRSSMRRVDMKVRRIGPGSASPVVSITTRLNIGATPRSASSSSRRSVNRTSPETVQHRQPVVEAKARSS